MLAFRQHASYLFVLSRLYYTWWRFNDTWHAKLFANRSRFSRVSQTRRSAAARKEKKKKKKGKGLDRNETRRENTTKNCDFSWIELSIKAPAWAPFENRLLEHTLNLTFSATAHIRRIVSTRIVPIYVSCASLCANKFVTHCVYPL